MMVIRDGKEDNVAGGTAGREWHLGMMCLVCNHWGLRRGWKGSSLKTFAGRIWMA